MTNQEIDLLVNARNIITSLKLSMLVHPDCTPGSEFDNMTRLAKDMEDEITSYFDNLPKLINSYIVHTIPLNHD